MIQVRDLSDKLVVVKVDTIIEFKRGPQRVYVPENEQADYDAYVVKETYEISPYDKAIVHKEIAKSLNILAKDKEEAERLKKSSPTGNAEKVIELNIKEVSEFNQRAIKIVKTLNGNKLGKYPIVLKFLIEKEKINHEKIL